VYSTHYTQNFLAVAASKNAMERTSGIKGTSSQIQCFPGLHKKGKIRLDSRTANCSNQIVTKNEHTHTTTRTMVLSFSLRSLSFRNSKPSSKKAGRKSSSLAASNEDDDNDNEADSHGAALPPARQRGTRCLVKDTTFDRHVLDPHSCSKRQEAQCEVLIKPQRPTHTRQGSDETTASTVSTNSTCTLDEGKLQAAVEFGRMIANNRRLPGVVPGFISGNHVMVNKERIAIHIPALTRRIELDAVARARAETMANEGKVGHGSLDDLEFQIRPCRVFDENIACGKSMQDIHTDMLKNEANRKKMVDRRYSYMGMGTARGKDGTLYLCQIFKG
jgi:uncharacterized protein YkwD